MERWNVIGYRKVSFKDEKAGKDISGYTLFLTRSGDDNITGEEAQKIFVSDEKIDYVPELGDEVELIYNRFGKVGDIRVI